MCSGCADAAADTAMITKMLNTAEPTMVPMPTLFSLQKVSTTDVNSSGADEPAAMNVAPATSSERFSRSEMSSSEATKNSSHTTAKPTKAYNNTKA